MENRNVFVEELIKYTVISLIDNPLFSSVEQAEEEGREGVCARSNSCKTKFYKNLAFIITNDTDLNSMVCQKNSAG